MTRSQGAPRKGDVWREKRLRPPFYDPRFAKVFSIRDAAPEIGIHSVQRIRGVWVHKPYKRTSWIAVQEFLKRFRFEEYQP